MSLARTLIAALITSVCFGLTAHAEPYVHPQTRIAFPDEIGGMRRGEINDYEAQRAGTGVGIRYQVSPIFWADVFIYNLGIQGVPTTIQDPLMQQVHAQTDRDVVTAAQARNGQARAAERSIVTVTASNGPALVFFDSYVVLQPGEVFNTFVWLWSARGHFLKIRMTRKAGDHDPKMAREFSEAVVRLTRQ